MCSRQQVFESAQYLLAHVLHTSVSFDIILQVIRLKTKESTGAYEKSVHLELSSSNPLQSSLTRDWELESSHAGELVSLEKYVDQNRSQERSSQFNLHKWITNSSVRKHRPDKFRTNISLCTICASVKFHTLSHLMFRGAVLFFFLFIIPWMLHSSLPLAHCQIQT